MTTLSAPRGEPRLAVVVAAVALVVGLVVGLAWRLLAPLPLLQVEQGGVFLAPGQAERAVAADGWFALCAAVAGLGCAVAAFLWARGARPGALVGLTVGGVLGALLARQLGAALGPGPVRAAAKGLPVGAFLDGPLKISADGVLVVWPLVGVVVYFALAAGLEVRPTTLADGSEQPSQP